MKADRPVGETSVLERTLKTCVGHGDSEELARELFEAISVRGPRRVVDQGRSAAAWPSIEGGRKIDSLENDHDGGVGMQVGLHFLGRNDREHPGQRKSRKFPLDVRRSIEFAPRQDRSEMHILSILRTGASIAGAWNGLANDGLHRFATVSGASCILLVWGALVGLGAWWCSPMRWSYPDAEPLLGRVPRMTWTS